MRSVIDPKRHYKKGDSKSKTLPKYFQVSVSRDIYITTFDYFRLLKSVDDRVDFLIYQVGTVIESASEFFSSRLTKKERKATLVDELLSDDHLRAYRYVLFAGYCMVNMVKRNSAAMRPLLNICLRY